MNNILKFLFRGVASSSNLILAIMLAAILDKNIAGTFFALQTTMIVLSLILRFGVDENIVRYINVHDVGVVHFLIGNVRVILMLLALPVMLSLYILIKYLGLTLNLLDVSLFFICIFLFTVSSIFGRFLQAKGKHTSAILILNLLMPFSLIISLYCADLAFTLSAKGVVLCFIFSSLLTFTISFFTLRVHENIFDMQAAQNDLLSSPEFFKSSFCLLCIVFLQNLPFWFITIYPMKHLGSESVAILNFNLKVASGISIFSVFLNFLIAPKVASNYEFNSHTFFIFYSKFFVFNLVCASFFGILLFYSYSYSISILGVYDYKSTIVFFEFIIFYILYSLCIYMTMIYSMTGRQKLSFYIYLFTIFLFLLASNSILNEKIESYSYLMLIYIVANFFLLLVFQIPYIFRRQNA
ncbi:hypothetical protein LCGC14_1516200 [marine sediment metagenome]|uniref:Polysaccharide biosynthesis protein C-terminal domain-containing protein n=1 Tax=marine sediment metagenome TaxID=412755 RepID=A0A0F9J056_9ZZZZ